MLDRRRVEMISGGVLLLIVLALAALFFTHHLDRSYITYRYALNVSQGSGLVYNPGQPSVLSGAVAPLYALILGLGALFTPSIPALSNGLGVVALALGGLAVYGLAQPAGKLTAVLTAGIYVTFPLLWITLGLETTSWLALGLGAIWLHLRKQGVGAALLLVLATFMRPEISVLVVVLGADSLASGRPFHFQPAGIYAGGVALGGLGALATYQPDGLLPGLPTAQLARALPDVVGVNVLAGLAALGGALFALSWLWPAVLALGIWGGVRINGHRWAILLTAWAGLHVLLLAILQVGVYPWNFAPLLPALAGLAALGLSDLVRRFDQRRHQWLVGGLAVALVAATGPLSDVRLASTPPDQATWRALSPTPANEQYAQVGAWLRDNIPAEARIGATRIGVLGYVSRRPLVDYHGSLQPEAAQALTRGDGQWWLADFAPEYVLLRSDEMASLDGYALSQDIWFASNYVEVMRFADPAGRADPLLLFRRTTPPPILTETLIGYVTYSNGLTLNGIACDFSLAPLEGGRVGLVRLEWLVDQTIPDPQYVAIQIQGRGSGAVGGLAGRMVDFSTWPHRRLITTYHPIQIAAGLPPGVYDISLGIGHDALSLTWQTIGQAKVPFQGVDILGGISGARTEFGDIALLGYRLAHTEQGLEVLLLWQAIHIPQADYRVFVQVRDLAGAIVTQAEFEPHGGMYPTSIWSAGEQVPDSYLLEAADIPPGDYQVYVGLINPDDTRILTLDGRDAVLVGQVSITP